MMTDARCQSLRYDLDDKGTLLKGGEKVASEQRLKEILWRLGANTIGTTYVSGQGGHKVSR